MAAIPTVAAVAALDPQMAAKHGTGDNGRHRQTAGKVTSSRHVDEIEQVVADTAPGHDMGHQ